MATNQEYLPRGASANRQTLYRAAMRTTMLCGALSLILVAHLAAQKAPADAPAAKPIDFAALDRTVKKAPPLSAEARYGLFLFGRNAEKRVFAILDRSKDAGDKRYDVLFFDRDADGDLTEDGERFVANTKGVFTIGDFTDPGTGSKHTEFTLTWTEASVRFRMLWRGDKVTFGGYGPERATYAQFAPTPAAAPVYVPGFDRPFEFEHWMSGTLTRGASTDFKVFVGNRGDRPGTFSAVDDEFLPAGDSPTATLLWTDAHGKAQRTPFELAQRC